MTAVTEEIERWIGRLREGDESARGELLARAGDRLDALAHRMLRGYPGVRRWEQTDDVRQAASLRLLRTLGEVTPGSAVEFFRLAALNIRRELIDLARRYSGPQGLGANHGSVDPDAPDPAPADETFEPARLAAWGEFHERVAALPDDERAVFDLVWYQGLAQADAAELLGVSERTVKRRWQAARLRLFEAMGGDLPGD
ncbi:MAG TPA: sigma-70 family RNA polymerase sigma factor [Isosphaeraceae bacterium]|jgi:RNA polymerase sigma-70 factor (ECF subfamily)|nr:sigma-70 family RNA polymerase sigma factor [Isosphaeraceae bacterium]